MNDIGLWVESISKRYTSDQSIQAKRELQSLTPSERKILLAWLESQENNKSIDPSLKTKLENKISCLNGKEHHTKKSFFQSLHINFKTLFNEDIQSNHLLEKINIYAKKQEKPTIKKRKKKPIVKKDPSTEKFDSLLNRILVVSKEAEFSALLNEIYLLKNDSPPLFINMLITNLESAPIAKSLKNAGIKEKLDFLSRYIKLKEELANKELTYKLAEESFEFMHKQYSGDEAAVNFEHFDNMGNEISDLMALLKSTEKELEQKFQ